MEPKAAARMHGKHSDRRRPGMVGRGDDVADWAAGITDLGS